MTEPFRIGPVAIRRSHSAGDSPMAAVHALARRRMRGPGVACVVRFATERQVLVTRLDASERLVVQVLLTINRWCVQ